MATSNWIGPTRTLKLWTNIDKYVKSYAEFHDITEEKESWYKEWCKMVNDYNLLQKGLHYVFIAFIITGNPEATVEECVRKVYTFVPNLDKHVIIVESNDKGNLRYQYKPFRPTKDMKKKKRPLKRKRKIYTSDSSGSDESTSDSESDDEDDEEDDDSDDSLIEYRPVYDTKKEEELNNNESGLPKEKIPVLHSDIPKAEELRFDEEDRIHPLTNCVIPVAVNTLPNDKQKLMIVIGALRMGYDEMDPASIRHRILQAARRKIHYICGLPEPAKNVRGTEKLIRSYLNAEAQGDEELIPTKFTRNRKSKIKKILESHPDLLHDVWRKATQTVGKEASFINITQVMNEILEVENHEFRLTKHNVIEFFTIFKGTLKREKHIRTKNLNQT